MSGVLEEPSAVSRSRSEIPGKHARRLRLLAGNRVARSNTRWGIVAVLMLGVAYSLLVPELTRAHRLFGNAGSHYALVRSLAAGTAVIDPYVWQTGDVSYFRGHFYSNKAPGLALYSLPAYSLLQAAGAPQKAVESTGSREKGALRIIWALGLWGAVLPATLLLLLVRHVAERFEPGLGTAASITLGLGSLVLPFSTLYFAHTLSALLGFTAFVLLWRERGRAADLRMVGLAGLVAGLAVLVEYPLVLIAGVVGLYGVSRRPLMSRGLTYAAGFGLGLLPLFLYNRWAYGAFTHLSYQNDLSFEKSPAAGAKAVTAGGEANGLADRGLFGLRAPHLHSMLDLLISSRGLLILTPVFAAAVAGTIVLYPRRRAEALTIGGVGLTFLLYNSAFAGSIGGAVPGPRFLIPILPFLAVALATGYRRFPGVTLGLAAVSAIMMVVATITQPLLHDDDTGRWGHLIVSGKFQDTIFTWLGAGDGWLAILPFLVVVLTSISCGLMATRGLFVSRRDFALGTAALSGWLAVAVLAPIGVRVIDVSSYDALPLLVGSFLLGMLSLYLAARVGAEVGLGRSSPPAG